MSSQSDELLVKQFIPAVAEATARELVVDSHEFGVTFDRPDSRRRLDALLHAHGPTGELAVAVEILRQGYPRDIRHAVWQLDEYRLATEGKPGGVLPMVIADYLSAGARDILRSRNIGYFDSSGSLYLKHGHWLINIDRAPAKPPVARQAGSLFTGAREQVVHTLLHYKARWLSGIELAGLAQTSAFTVSLTLKELEKREWLECEGSGRTLRRRLAQPGKLLDEWSQVWTARTEEKSRWYMYALKSGALPFAIGQKLDSKNFDGLALTGAAAANMLTPLLTSVETVELIVPPGSTGGFAEALDLKPADKGFNIVLIERSGASTLFNEQLPNQPIRFAPPFIQYLDLQDGRGRNRELAEQLRQEVLKV